MRSTLRDLKVLDSPPPLLSSDTSKTLSAILQHLNLSSVDSKIASDFSDSFEFSEFQLGDQLLSDILAEPSEPIVHCNLNNNSSYLYLVCQGRVRLLGFDSVKQRDVSALVIEEGGTFGADNLLSNVGLPYRAIAASSGVVARISLAQLQPWLEQLPELEQHLLRTAKHRQCLIFLKTLTQLRHTSSLTIQQLLPYLVEEQIAAGESIAQLTSGRYWLRSGQIESGRESLQPPAVGESWGYPNSTPTDWIAQTDLCVYRLLTEHWETAQVIAPALVATSLESTNKDKTSQNGHPKSTVNQVVVHPPRTRHRKSSFQVTSTQTRDAPSDSITSRAESESIDFPQPLAQRRLGRGFWRRYPFIQQQSSSDCGVACLAMIGRYWGKRFSMNSLRELAGVGRSGASLKSLAKASESVGFRATPVRASLSRLVERSHPWIAHWQGDHYIVVYRVKGDRVFVADPAIGKRSLPRSEFLAGWTGYALLLDPTPELAIAESEKLSLNRFWGLLWPHRSVLVQIVIASLLLQAFGLITPLFTQIILDRVIVNKSLITLQVFCIGLILFGLWRIGLGAIRRYLLDYFFNQLSLIFTSGFINHTLKLPLKFFESRQVGDILTRVQETRKIQAFLTQQAISTWLDVVMVFVSVGLMLYYNWQLTLLVLATIPPIAILTVVASPFLRQLSREIFHEAAAQNSLLVEMMTGIATVKAAAAEQEVRWRWEDRLTSTFNVKFKAQNLSNSLNSISGLFNTLGSTALLWYGATLVIQDHLTIGQFVAFNMLIGRVTSPILSLVGLWDQFQEILVSVERLNDVFASQPEESSQKALLVLPELRGEVQMENVTFRYNEEEDSNILQNISFEAYPGQTVAIVGRSGSGKSTLVKLIQGMYHTTSGRVCVDGHDIRHVAPHSLRSQLGVVPQECFLFSGTILENITLYRPEFTLEQVVEVAKLAEAHAFIQSLPLGYNTKVGERGATLSGGQRQRIAIARALLDNPRILILDEATSSLDTESERRFQQNLARIKRDRTTLIIAHRLSTVRNADCILVLDRGILVEQGTHDELMALEGLYYHLAQQQLAL